MIQLLATRYSKHIAYIQFLIFSCTLTSVYGSPYKNYPREVSIKATFNYVGKKKKLPSQNVISTNPKDQINNTTGNHKVFNKDFSPNKGNIGGPGQPEMSSFKPAGTDNMVNLFTGDFSYNIPLLDVGGYPVNIFYSGGITPEQEASWVGLGWNINPGTVTRNMRGVPDDFNGQDEMIQVQNMKPNRTWGLDAGYDLELVGIDALENIASGSVGFSAGYSYNNYLGPAIDFGVHGNTKLSIATKAGSEKNLAIGAGIGANVNSRNGLTISPNVSLTANLFKNVKGLEVGGKASTSYNSRTGIKQLQLSEQMSYNFKELSESSNNALKQFTTLNTPITFAKPSYIPAIRMPVTNESWAGRYEAGVGWFGVKGSFEPDVYIQRSHIAAEDRTQRKRMAGYLYYEKANNDPNVVMDFTRFNDNEVMPKTPVISVPQYSYDVFTIQGEGTGGSIRAYRNDLGYVRDIATRSKDRSFSGGLDIAPGGHYGANFSQIKTPSYIGDWTIGNQLKNTPALQFKPSEKDFENVYFRNPGETSVLNNGQFSGIGGTDLVRFKLGGSNANPIVQPILERFSKLNVQTETTPVAASYDRKKRTQVTSFLTAEETEKIGLDAGLKDYNDDPATMLKQDHTLDFTSNPRYDDIVVSPDDPTYEQHYRKRHHISQINVTETDGRRYIYGLPVYNIKQEDYSFSVGDADPDADMVGFEMTNTKADDTNTFLDPHNKGKDGFVQITTTPAYAHSFLLTGLLSPDYVDVAGDGITEDDLGDAVKFNYTFTDIHKWKTPLTAEANKANFNAGHRSEGKDDKGIISYGERETWYLHSIESKTMIAIFTLENRNDGKGVGSEFSGVNPNDNSQKRLKKIDLYSKPDVKKNGLTGPNAAKPIKTVRFQYSYTLCQGTPDNPTSGGGKLTLDGIYFTFNGVEKISKNKYVFSYGNTTLDNPSYSINSSDRWGTYKPKENNPRYSNNVPLKNTVYPYSKQDKTIADQNAAAWSLKTILLPSGGQIEVEYESDDYAFVQNKRAAVMMQVLGFGKDDNINNLTNSLYRYDIIKKEYVDNEYVFIKVPDANGNIKTKYLQGLDQLAFKLSVNMPKGDEYITCYANAENWGKSNDNTIWVKLKTIRYKDKDYTPIIMTVLDYLREQLPGQAFPGYDVSEETGLKQIVQMFQGIANTMNGAFKDPLKYFREQGFAKKINTDRSFARLNEPTGHKYGGGQRVKSIKLKDNWQAMTGQYTSTYGQEYDYTTSEVFSGIERKISSGVATYEPSIGGEENPFQSIMQVTDQLPLGPASIGSIEMPVLDAFFPAPGVGYSKVTVKSIGKDYVNTATHKSRSGIGKQMTEFYTAKDFPVSYQHTPLQPDISDKVCHKQSALNFFYSYALDSRAISQGFLIATNDMHGKLKSQASYAEGDDKTPINYTENFYRNTGSTDLDEFDFVFANEGGNIKKGNMGVDIELMTDVREFSVKSISDNIQAQVDELVPPFGWFFFGWDVQGNSEDVYRAVTTTKVINYHGVLESVKVIDKGSMVTTKNLVFDSETGDVVVSETKNEFDLPVYNINYPAYWAYSGMGLAYKNINTVYNTNSVEFRDGKIVSGMTADEIKNTFESGDELYIIHSEPSDYCTAEFSGSGDLMWAFDKNRNSSTNSDFVFMDSKGKLFTAKNVSFKIVRSGKRNMLSASVAGISSMNAPVNEVGGIRKLVIDNAIVAGSANKVISASAVEYKEKWQTDKDNIRRLKLVSDETTCTANEVEYCNGYLEKNINPYRKGLLGNFRAYRNMVFYGSRAETNPLDPTNLPRNGFLIDFHLYWDFSGSNLMSATSDVKWVWNMQTTRFNARGLELETKDANEIFTAAQYGYHKTLPTAIVNNSRNNEMMYEGFEDDDYSEFLNPVQTSSCSTKKIDFPGIVPADVVGINAHSGKHVLKIEGNNTISKELLVNPSNALDYDLTLIPDGTKSLIDQGGNFTISNVAPPYPFEGSYNVSIDGNNPRVYVNIQPTDQTSTGNRYHYYTSHWDLYMQITEAKTYSFSVSLSTSYNNYGASINAHSNSSTVRIYDVQGRLIDEHYIQQGQFEPQALNYSVFLCPGIYKIESYISELYSASNTGSNVTSGNIYNWSCNNSTSLVYRSLATQNGCTYTKPIAANENMLHSNFGVPTVKKMLFSAWIYQGASTSSSVQFEYDGVDQPPILPAGPVIEGWQRIEGEFTIPQSVTSVKLKLINPNNQPIYFDDIRIHPYNANMKSYVYDPISLRLTAQLDANNYATFYEYDGEGTLIRTKTETKEGVKTLNETRSFKQAKITAPQ